MKLGEKSADRFNWRLPLYGSAGAAIVVLPVMILGNDVIGVSESAAIGAIISLIMMVILFRTIRLHGMAAMLMLALFGAGCWLLLKVADDVRTSARWLIESRKYKSEILGQRYSAKGELKHVEWDVWGFAGVETEEYLVFDPNDSLAVAAESHSAGKYSGIPCEVRSVRRLESRWYAVVYYSETDWNHCSY